jgi:hypothetical protein
MGGKNRRLLAKNGLLRIIQGVLSDSVNAALVARLMDMAA